MLVNTGGGSNTIKAAGVLVTPKADAVTCIVPADTPVATPLWNVAMALPFAPSFEGVHVNVIPVIGLWYWSKP